MKKVEIDVSKNNENEIKRFKIAEFRNLKGLLIDVRSPTEFRKGHLPHAINIPLFNDEERSKIGIVYKYSGREQAVLKGIKTISDNIQIISEKITDLTINIKDENLHNKLIKIYCARGGMRSYGMSWLCAKMGFKSAILENGYKSYRNWVLKTFKKKWPICLIGGKTGTGKTDIIQHFLENGIPSIDLENIANHRGSAFGGLGLEAQPTNESFENMLSEELNKYNNTKDEIYIEAESANIGTCRIPFDIFNQMKDSRIIELVKTDEERIKTLIDIYSKNSKISLKEAVLKIQKRIGLERAIKTINFIENEQWESVCNEILSYYDKCYQRELNKRKNVKSINTSNLSLAETSNLILKTK